MKLLPFPAVIIIVLLVISCNDKTKTKNLKDDQTLSTKEEIDGIQQETDPNTGESFDFKEEIPAILGGDSSGLKNVHQDIQNDTVWNENERFWSVDEMPTFNGGDPYTEFPKFIAQNLQYPESALNDGISGRVIVQFFIDYEGKVIDLKVVMGVNEALDDEAIRIVSTSSGWTPGKHHGKRVIVGFTFPIHFILQ